MSAREPLEGPAAIEIRDADVSYRGRSALSRINLKINNGSFVALIGPNGAGKTTLLSLVNGLAAPSGGEVRVFGRRLTPKTAGGIRKRIGYVSQAPAGEAGAQVSVYEAVSIGRFGKRGLFRRLGRDDREAVERAIAAAGLQRLKNRPVALLSGGEKQKTAIARALAQEPEIMLLDEPTSSLDMKARKEITEIIDGIYRESRVTVLYVTHVLGHLPRSCTRAVMIRDGRIIRDGGIAGIYDRELIAALYGLSEESVDEDAEHPGSPLYA